MTGMHLATAWLLFCRRRSSLASISAPTIPPEMPYAHYPTKEGLFVLKSWYVSRGWSLVVTRSRWRSEFRGRDRRRLIPSHFSLTYKTLEVVMHIGDYTSLFTTAW